MATPLLQHLNKLSARSDVSEWLTILSTVYDRLSTQTLNSAGLAIGTGDNKKVKVVNSTYAFANGILVNVAAATEAALSGVVTNAKFNVFCLFVDSAATVTTVMGTEGAALGNVKFPTIPQQKAMIGFVVINPTGTGNFTGASTALNDGTVVPNAVYVNTTGPVEPTAVL